MSVLITVSGVKPAATEEDLRAAFADESSRGDCVVLELDEGSVLQALGEGFGPYTLEYFPSPRTGTHLRACDEWKRQEVLDALVDCLRGGTAWRDDSTWREVEDDEGGIAAGRAALGSVVPWALIFAGILLTGHAASRAAFHHPIEGTFLSAVAGLTCLVSGAACAVRRRGPTRPAG